MFRKRRDRFVVMTERRRVRRKESLHQLDRSMKPKVQYLINGLRS